MEVSRFSFFNACADTFVWAALSIHAVAVSGARCFFFLLDFGRERTGNRSWLKAWLWDYGLALAVE